MLILVVSDLVPVFGTSARETVKNLPCDQNPHFAADNIGHAPTAPHRYTADAFEEGPWWGRWARRMPNFSTAVRLAQLLPRPPTRAPTPESPPNHSRQSRAVCSTT